MFQQVELLLVGLAALIDTALLWSFVERRNWRHVTVPVALLVAGAWLWHAGAFAKLLLAGWTTPAAAPAHWLAMFAMAAGLLLIPSAMVHGCWRLARSGLKRPSHGQWRYAVAYLPLAMLV